MPVASKMASVVLVAVLLVCPAHAYEGWNFSVQLQRRPLDKAVAVGKLKSAVGGAVQNAKIFDYDRDLVGALVAGGVRNIVVAVPNPQVWDLSRSDGIANTVADVLAPHVRNGVQFTVAISNEPTSNGPIGAVLPALQNMRRVLNQRGLGGVRLTVPFDYGIMGNSYPPRAGTLNNNNKAAVAAIARFLRDDRSPFFINIYTYFARGPQVPLDYALLKTSHTASDSVTYPTMLHAMFSALRAGLLNADGSLNDGALPIVIGETGWPTGGGGADTSVANAATYYANIRAKAKDLNFFFFEAFDEATKNGGAVEPFWGFMYEDGTPKFGGSGPGPSGPINWQVGADGYWALGCDFKGGDLTSSRSPGEKCSGVCKSTPDCTHYAWSSYNGGTCWMKQGAATQSDAVPADAGVVCGINSNANSGISWNGSWANGCDFNGQDLRSSKTIASNCGPTCKTTPSCTHFTWTNFNGGTCWMKQGSATKSSAIPTGDKSMVCGFP